MALGEYSYILNGVETTGQLSEAHAEALGATLIGEGADQASEDQPVRKASRKTAKAPANKARSGE